MKMLILILGLITGFGLNVGVDGYSDDKLRVVQARPLSACIRQWSKDCCENEASDDPLDDRMLSDAAADKGKRAINEINSNDRKLKFVEKLPLSACIRKWPEASFEKWATDVPSDQGNAKEMAADDCERAVGVITLYIRSDNGWQQMSKGCGVVIAHGGRKVFLTAAHVISSTEKRGLVKLVISNNQGEMISPTQVIGVDRLRDLCWLSIDDSKFGSVPLAKHSDIRRGCKISTWSSDPTFGLFYQEGHINAVFRETEVDLIATSTRSQMGWSGSPVFTQEGHLAAITIRLQPSFRLTNIVSGDHFAESVIPVSVVVAR